jgi:asparagine synthase (glutamine-hydrolysing)
MCGIAGAAHRHGPVDRAVVATMAETQRHRGPDGYGTAVSDDGRTALGMNLLSVVGTGTQPGPYRLTPTGIMLVFNGEIYNWRDLATRWGFPVLPGETDAHLLLRAWTRFGPSCLSALDGMFAFALHDPCTHELVIVRDRFGEKPVYLRMTSESLHFASEVKSIDAVVPLQPRIPDGWSSIETPLGEDTLYEDVELIRPASLVRIDLRSWTRREQMWWDISDQDAETPLTGTASEGFGSLLTDAVASRKSAGRDALMLSGGLDSAVLARVLQPDVLITVRYPGHARYDEVDNARVVAESVGSELVVIEPTEEDLVDNLDAIVYALDYPVGNASILSEFILYRRLAELGVKVVHGGIGPDEFLLGYVRHALAMKVPEAAQLGRFGAYRPLADKFIREGFGSRSTAERYYRGILRGPDSSGAVHQLVHEQFAASDDIGKALTRVDLTTSFPPLLLCADKLSSSFGLERRSPFLAHRWASFCYALPLAAKQSSVHTSPTKEMLRQYARDVGVPSQIVDDDDKRGFASPVPSWLTTSLRSWADQRIGRGRRARLPSSGPQPSPQAPFDRTRFMDLLLSAWMDQADGRSAAGQRTNPRPIRNGRTIGHDRLR